VAAPGAAAVDSSQAQCPPPRKRRLCHASPQKRRASRHRDGTAHGQTARRATVRGPARAQAGCFLISIFRNGGAATRLRRQEHPGAPLPSSAPEPSHSNSFGRFSPPLPETLAPPSPLRCPGQDPHHCGPGLQSRRIPPSCDQAQATRLRPLPATGTGQVGCHAASTNPGNSRLSTRRSGRPRTSQTPASFGPLARARPAQIADAAP